MCGRNINFIALYSKTIPPFKLKELVEFLKQVIQSCIHSGGSKDEVRSLSFF